MPKIEKLNPAFAERTAYVCGEKSISYVRLYNRAEKAAALLKRQGKAPVALLGNKSPEMLISLLACVMARRAYVPLEDDLPRVRIASAIEQAGCTLVLKNGAAEFCGSIPCSTLEQLEHAPAEPKNSAAKNDTAYIIFTSGSTGKPKGVPISYENLENFVRWICSDSVLSEYDPPVVFNPASFGFDLSVAGIYYSLAVGGTVVTVSREEQKSFDGIFAAIEKNKANIIVATPTFIKLCLLNGDFREENFKSVGCCWFCGERLEKALCERLFARFPRLRIINAYGPTEATCAVCSSEITPADMEAGDPLPAGDISSAACEVRVENGEIVLSGKSVFCGYIGSAVKSGRIFSTGDLGKIRNGKLYCAGRGGSRIKYKGFRIELGDIEANILSVSGVTACAAAAKSGKNGETAYIKAFVAAEPELSAEALRAELKKLLPEYMIPKVIELLPKLPVNANGKIDRRLLERL